MEFELICDLHRNAPERVDAIFSFPVLLISTCSKNGTPFLSQTAKTCQHYFSNFLTRMQKDMLPPNKPQVEPAKHANKDLKKNDECRMSNDEGMTKSECRKMRIVPIAI